MCCFLDKTGSTRQIWYYEVNPPYKLTKNKPLLYEHFQEFLALLPTRGIGENSWLVNVGDVTNYDLSAKNPAKRRQEARLSSAELLALIQADNERINGLVAEVAGVLQQ